jgi:hypothetical protein
MRRAAKVDANQEQIVSALRAAGASVQSLAPIGKGCPDLLVGFRDDNYLFEVKRGKEEPNDLQAKWHITWCAHVYVVRSADDALRAIGVLA